MTTSVLTGLPAPTGSSTPLRRSLLATPGLRLPVAAAPSGVLVPRAVYTVALRASTFFLPLPLPGAPSMMALPTDPAKSAWIGKHEAYRPFQLDLTNGLAGDTLAAVNPITPLLLEVKNGQQTTDVSATKLKSWAVSGAAPFTLTFIIGDGAQRPGYTYLAGAYVTTSNSGTFEAYIAIPCPGEPGL